MARSLKIVVLAFLFSAWAWQADAIYSTGGALKLVTPRNFREKILDSELPAIVEFYAPWCGHCKSLAPIYQKVAESLRGIVNVAAVDCDVEANKSLCGKYEVKGFPTLKTFAAGKGNKHASDYQGPRTAGGIANAATAALHDKLISRLTTSEAFSAFLQASDLPKVVLYSSKAATSTLYKSLSMRFKGRLNFAEVRQSAEKLIQAGGVTSFPSLQIVATDGSRTPFEGKLSANALVPFLVQIARASAPDLATGQQAEGEEAGEGGGSGEEKAEGTGEEKDSRKAERPQPPILALSLGTLEEVLDTDDVWLIAAFEGSEGEACKGAAADFAKLVSDLGPLAKFGELNITGLTPDALEERGVAAVQAADCKRSLFLKPFGEQSEPDDPFPLYTGSMTGKDVQAFVLPGFSNEVPRLTDAMLPAFMRSEQDKAKIILFTGKDETPAVFRALAHNGLELGFVFADVHESEETLMKEFNIKKVPTMLMVLAVGGKARVQQMPPSFRYKQMYGALQDIAGLVTSLRDGNSEPGASGGGSGKVTHVDDNTTFAAECGEKLGLCVVSVLDPAAAEHERQLDELLTIARLRSGQPLHFMWVDATRQPSFIEAFGLQRSDAPAAIALAAKKRRFKILPGDFDAKSLNSLLDGLLSGRERTMSIQEVPKLTDGGEQLSEVILEEDEFDLADIMGEGVGAPELRTEL